MSTNSDLYHQDFYAWTQTTAALLIVEAHVSTKEGALIGVVKGIQVVEGKAAAQSKAHGV